MCSRACSLLLSVRGAYHLDESGDAEARPYKRVASAYERLQGLRMRMWFSSDRQCCYGLLWTQAGVPVLLRGRSFLWGELYHIVLICQMKSVERVQVLWNQNAA